MSSFDLSTDEGLRAALDSLGRPSEWADGRGQWHRDLMQTIQWIRSTDQAERASSHFQERLWENNHVAATGQGNISVETALADERFRQWLAERSLQPLPHDHAERRRFLQEFYGALLQKLTPYGGRMPHLKILRVIAALYPEAMTTVADRSALQKLVRAMGGRRREVIEAHLWIRERLDQLLGDAGSEPAALAERIAIPWQLYERFVRTPTGEEGVGEGDGDDQRARLEPLPAARRRRGLTSIRGGFTTVLSALEFVQPGVTRPELLDFLRAASPGLKESSLGMIINVLQSELGTIEREGDQYVLTDRGAKVLESGDSVELADFLLTRVLGVDKALMELRTRAALARAELTRAIRGMNPGWTSDFVPQSMISWLTSLGLVESVASDAGAKLTLTDAGELWADRIHWPPEPLQVAEIPVLPAGRDVVLPPLPQIVARVRERGFFPGSLIAGLHAGLWSHRRRHFAILTGLSGSGKTLLARSYAHALAQDDSDAQLITVPVQPGWYDPGALLGYVSPLAGESFVDTPFLRFLLEAAQDPERPHVVVLDEMNLSHPEQYMAPILSAMETGGAIELHTAREQLDGVPASLPYPENLVIIGTVNMDETTHGLSDKILDRAFVLEFWESDLDRYPNWDSSGLSVERIRQVREVLGALMAVLAPARLHFGWRVVDDVLGFLAKSADASEALPFDSALDRVVHAKVLPKLRGEDSLRFREALGGCVDVCRRFGLVQAAEKVAELERDLTATGSARFWR